MKLTIVQRAALARARARHKLGKKADLETVKSLQRALHRSNQLNK